MEGCCYIVELFKSLFQLDITYIVKITRDGSIKSCTYSTIQILLPRNDL